MADIGRQWQISSKLICQLADFFLPLQLAIDYGNVDICKILVDNGSEVNAPLHDGNPDYTSIHVAAGSGKLAIVQYLLAQGADIFDPMSVSNLIDEVAKGDKVEILDYCLQHAYNKLGENMNVHCWHEELFEEPFGCSARRCVLVLLHWGIYTCTCPAGLEDDSDDEDEMCVDSPFSLAAAEGDISSMEMMIELKQQCLQESWLVGGTIKGELAAYKAFTA